ncbi:MAG TPA: tyrosine-type recombinase/integrase [Candidatus Limnocylindrales bacterium]|nr:tyrosine-type recombinase/integrase [Candidatus Limnocylindrales bacterium]
MTGSPIHRSTANKLWHAQLHRAGLPSLPFHSARHGFATMQLEAGTSARVVQAALGHSTPNITLSIYSHVRPALASEAADRMKEALRGPLTAVRDSSTRQQEPPETASGRLN